MPSRQTYREVLQLRADLWRIPCALCIATLVFFVLTIQIDRAAARGVVTLPAWVSVGGVDDARAILGSMLGAVSSAPGFVKADRADIEAAYRKARVALGATL